MSSTNKALITVLAVIAFTAGILLRHTAHNSVYRAWSTATDVTKTRQMAAFDSQGAASDVGRQSNVDLRPMETFYSVYRIVQDHYVERVQDGDKKALTYSSVRTMLDSLKDPYSRFYEADQTEVLEAGRQGKFYGIGAVFAVKKEKIGDITNEKLCVVTTLPGSPAEKAGVQTGDVVTEIDGKPVLPYDPYQRAAKLLKSARNGEEDRDKLQKELDAEDKRIKNGISFQKSIDQLSARLNSEYTLTISRSGSPKPVKVKVAAGETVVDPVSHAMIGNDVGYIRIRFMSPSSAKDFAEAMKAVEDQGAKYLVLDLRNAPAGSPDTALRIASWFAPNKVFTNILRAHNKKQVVKIPAFEKPEGIEVKQWTGKTAVLVNGGTANTAEVLAAALRDNKVAQTVGSTTFGQALQQTVTVLKDGSAFGITTGKYLTPLGSDFNIKGLPADVRVAQAGKDDTQLARAVELVKAEQGSN